MSTSLLIILTKKLKPRETKQHSSHISRVLHGDGRPDLSPFLYYKCSLRCRESWAPYSHRKVQACATHIVTIAWKSQCWCRLIHSHCIKSEYAGEFKWLWNTQPQSQGFMPRAGKLSPSQIKTGMCFFWIQLLNLEDPPEKALET